MLKLISADQLRVGMFVEAFEGATLTAPVARRRFLLEHEVDANALKQSNLDGVYINTTKGHDVSPTLGEQKPPERTFAEEKPHDQFARLRLSSAERLELRSLKQTMKMLKCAFKDVEAGNCITSEDVAPMIANITRSMARNPEVLIGITRLKLRDEATFLHSIAVSALMVRFSQCLKIEPETVSILGMAGLLHDIGKIGLPIDLLTKSGALTEDEMSLVRTHPINGYNILTRKVGMPQIVLDVCLSHHERMDGKGYPVGLTADKISLYSRMAAICDVYDALTSTRPYKRPWTSSEAAAWMLDAAHQFDRKLLGIFFGVVMRF